MNNLNFIDQATNKIALSSQLSDFITTHAGKIEGRKFLEIDTSSNLPLALNKLNQVAQFNLGQIANSLNIENEAQKEISASGWPPQGESEDDLFGEEGESNVLNNINKLENTGTSKESSGTSKEISGTSKESSGIKEKEESTVEVEKGAVEVEKNAVTMDERMTKTNALRNRVITADKVERIKLVFAGDLALAFEKSKPARMQFIQSLSHSYMNRSSSTYQKVGITDFEDINLMALRGFALRLNARGNEELVEEDVEKASNKINDLLRPDMKGEDGKPISDEKFLLIKEEIKAKK